MDNFINTYNIFYTLFSLVQFINKLSQTNLLVIIEFIAPISFFEGSTSKKQHCYTTIQKLSINLVSQSQIFSTTHRDLLHVFKLKRNPQSSSQKLLHWNGATLVLDYGSCSFSFSVHALWNLFSLSISLLVSQHPPPFSPCFRNEFTYHFSYKVFPEATGRVTPFTVTTIAWIHLILWQYCFRNV